MSCRNLLKGVILACKTSKDSSAAPQNDGFAYTMTYLKGVCYDPMG